MNRPKMRKPLGARHDQLTGLFFDLIVYALRNRIKEIKWHDLEKEGNNGIYSITTKKIYINENLKLSKSKSILVEVLIHEVLHNLFPNLHYTAKGNPSSKGHTFIYDLSRVLARRFTERQKKFLLEFLPQ